MDTQSWTEGERDEGNAALKKIARADFAQVIYSGSRWPADDVLVDTGAGVTGLVRGLWGKEQGWARRGEAAVERLCRVKRIGYAVSSEADARVGPVA